MRYDGSDIYQPWGGMFSHPEQKEQSVEQPAEKSLLEKVLESMPVTSEKPN